jgi:nicotinate phosphoribosyltransferase
MIPDIATSGLLTDLYQFTMVQGYLEHDLQDTATFEFFVRKLPQQRNFLIAAGLEQFLEFVTEMKFSQADIEWLAKRGFRAKLLNFLSNFRFTGDVHALPEGTILFPDEPLLRVTAPLPQAQLLETRAINLLHFQTLIASKAARMVLAAPNKQLVDFGLRRAHGAEAGLLAARASYAVGFAGTSTVLAGQRFGIPIYGTMAHSFVEAYADEATAFEHFATANPHDVAFILDTYDTEAAAHKVVSLAARLAKQGIQVRAVRLDSGDLAAHARRVRRILDEGGLKQTRIVASGGLDEDQLADLTRQNAPIDSFGVGTRLDVSADAPYLDCAYKLVEYAGQPRRKRSEGKAIWPGRKQVYRYVATAGHMDHDLIALESDTIRDAHPLLAEVMRGGRPVDQPPTLDQIRDRTRQQLEQLPAPWKSLDPAPEFRVEISNSLRNFADKLDQKPS